MPYQLDVKRLAVLVRTKRAGRGLREVADEIGEVSPSTLSRLENCKTPDMMVFLRICDWLQISPAQLFCKDNRSIAGEDGRSDLATSEQIDVMIRSDKTLDAATANVLAAIVKAAYSHLSILPSAE